MLPHPLSLLVPSVFPRLAVLDCERTNAPYRTTRDISLPALAFFLFYYECNITLPRRFVSRKPTPNKQHHLPLPFLISSQFLASVLLHIVTHLSQRLSFHLRLPLTLLRLGVAKSVRYPLPVPCLDFTHPPPHFPSCRRKTPLTFFFDTAGMGLYIQ